MITQVKLAGAKRVFVEGHPVAKCEKTTGLIDPWDVVPAGLSRPLISGSLLFQWQFFLLQASSALLLLLASHVVIHSHFREALAGFPNSILKKSAERRIWSHCFRSQAHPWCILPRPRGHVVGSYMSRSLLLIS